MSDSSSSDEEASRFREACDPTLWRTAAAQGAAKNETCRVEALSDEKPQRPSQGDQRQAFMLLEKIRTTLAEAQGKAGCVGLRHRNGHGPGTQGRPSSGRAEASTARVAMAAPSTLSPFLAKQLTSRLDGSVEYQGDQEHRLTRDGSCEGGGGGGGGGQPLHQPLRLLTNLALAPQGSTDPTHAAARRSRPDRVPKRLSYFDGCDKERLKAQCRDVAVPSEWILSGQAAHPRPHPKNVRYLEEYKLKERRADGTLVAVPCSLPDNTSATAGKRKKKKSVACVSQAGKEERDSSHQEQTHTGLQNGGVSEGSRTKRRRGEGCASQAGEEEEGSSPEKQKEALNGLTNGVSCSNTNVIKQRKQARRRGKKKKVKEGDEAVIP